MARQIRPGQLQENVLYNISASFAVSASHEITHEVSSSYAETASFAVTASHLLNNPPAFPFTGDAQITGSLVVSGSGINITSGSITGDGSGLTNISSTSLNSISLGLSTIVGDGASSAASYGTVFGKSAASTGGSNVGIGAFASVKTYGISIGHSVAGSTGTVAIGYNVGHTSGEYNVLLGHQAGNNTSGNYNISLGFLAGFDQTTGTGNITIGSGSRGLAGESNQLRIGHGIHGATISASLETGDVIFASTASAQYLSTPAGNLSSISASYALTASHALNGGGGGGIFTDSSGYKQTINNLIISESNASSSLSVINSGSTIFDVQGSVGQLFEVADGLDGVLMSVNDISGIPILTVSSSGDVFLAAGSTLQGTAATASFVPGISAAFPFTGSAAISGSLNINGSGSGIFDVDGTVGSLFSVNDGLDGILMSVNDISGLPLFEVSSSGDVEIHQGNISGSSTSTASFGHYIGDGSNITGIISASYALTASHALNVSVPTLQQVTDQGASTSNDITISGDLTASADISLPTNASYIKFNNAEIFGRSGGSYPGLHLASGQSANSRIWLGDLAQTTGEVTMSFLAANGNSLFDNIHILRSANNRLLILQGAPGPNDPNDGVRIQTGDASNVYQTRFEIEADAANVDAYFTNINGLGINDDTPSATLDVNGNINTTSHITASGNVSSSAASTASFGTYLGDGSQLTGISTTPFPFNGDAVITGSLVVSGSGTQGGLRTNTRNIILGQGAGHDQNATNGPYNVMIGYQAGYTNTTGDSNVCIGQNAGYALSTNASDDNIFIGKLAGAGGTSPAARMSDANYNIGLGYETMLYLTSGDSNIGFGFRTMRNISSGKYNLAFGDAALYNTDTGQNNIGLGYYAGLNQTSGNGNITIGSGSLGVAGESNQLRIGNGNTLTTISASLETGDVIFSSTASAAYFVGNGSGLTNIPASGITGLNLSQIASGSTSASAAPNTGVVVEHSGSTAFSVIGDVGTLFSVDDSLTGTLFSANDISGFPILQADSTGEVYLGKSPQSLYTTSVVSSTTAATTHSLVSLSTSSYDGAFFEYTAISSSNARAGSIMSVWNGANIVSTETTSSQIGDTTDLTTEVIISGSTARLVAYGANASYKIKTIIKAI